MKLALKKDIIVEKWFTRVIESYPAETARFLRGQKDPFANPVGQTTLQNLATLVVLLDKDLDAKAARAALDPIVRIRAVQDFTAAQAVRFVFDLKKILRDLTTADQDSQDEMHIWEQRIDELALTAFDIYMQCREKIYALQAEEVKRQRYQALVRAGLIKDSKDD